MRILWFSNTPGLGGEYINTKVGGGGWITALQKALIKTEGCQFGYVFYSDTALPSFDYKGTTYLPIQRKDDSKMKRWLWRFMEKVEYDENIPQFIEAIERFKPDIIHIHGSENPFGLIIPHVQDIPVVISIQGNLTVYAKKFFSGLPKPQGMTSMKPENFLLRKKYKSFLKKAEIEREMLGNSRYILGRTDWDRRISKVLAPKARYFHADEVIRPEFYQEKWGGWPSGKTTYLTTSSNSHYKGFETILDTAVQLKALGHDFQWAIAGLSPGDELVAQSMKSRNIHDLDTLGIKLLGHLSVDKIIQWMLKAHCYVQVSHIENSPNSLCEAMLLGLPIISSYAGGSATMVQGGKCALLVQDGDPYALAGALLELGENKEKAMEMAERAHLAAHERHDPKKISEALLSTYSSIIKENRRAVESPESQPSI